MAEDFNLSTKPLLNTATGKFEQNNVDSTPEGLNIDPTNPKINSNPSTPSISEPLEELNIDPFKDSSYVDDSAERAKLDPSNTGGYFRSTIGLYNNIMAEEQSEGDKLGRTLIRGIGKGLSGAVGLPLEGIGWAMKQVGIESGEYLMNLDQNINNALNEALPVHERELSQDAGFVDNLLRYNTMESIVDSAVEFGVLGMGVGAGVGLAGKGMMALGATLDGAAGATIASNLLVKGGTGIIKGANIGRVFGKPISYTSVVAGLTNNAIEGHVMAGETKNQLEQAYSTVLYNNDVPQERKDKIRKSIDDAGKRVFYSNLLLGFIDIGNFASIDRFIGNGGAKKGLFSTLGLAAKTGGKESIEEYTQNILQQEAAYQETEDIEIKLKDAPVGTEDVSGLWETDPDRAEDFFYKQSLSTFQRFLDYGSSVDARVEAVSGALGGGPQWLITGGPTKYTAKNRKLRADVQNKKKEYLDNFSTSYQDMIKDQVMSDMEFNSMVEEVTEKTQVDSDIVKESIENYAIEKAAADAVKNNQEENLYNYLSETLNKIKKDKASGKLSSEDYTKFSKRIKDTQKAIDKYKGLSIYRGSTQLIQAELNKVMAENVLNGLEKTKTRATDKAAVYKSFSISEDSFDLSETGETNADSKEDAKPASTNELSGIVLEEVIRFDGEVPVEVEAIAPEDVESESEILVEYVEEFIQEESEKGVDLSVALVRNSLIQDTHLKPTDDTINILDTYIESKLNKQKSGDATSLETKQPKEQQEDVTDTTQEDKINTVAEDVVEKETPKPVKERADVEDMLSEVRSKIETSKKLIRDLKSSSIQAMLYRAEKKDREYTKLFDRVNKLKTLSQASDLERKFKNLPDNTKTKGLHKALEDKVTLLKEISEETTDVVTNKPSKFKRKLESVVGKARDLFTSNDGSELDVEEILNDPSDEILTTKDDDTPNIEDKESSSIHKSETTRKVTEVISREAPNIENNLEQIYRSASVPDLTQSVDTSNPTDALEPLQDTLRLLQLLKKMRPDNSYPSRDEAQAQLKAAGVTSEVAMKGLDLVYTNYIEPTQIGAERTKRMATSTSNDRTPFQVKDSGSPNYVHTSATYVVSAAGIGWVRHTSDGIETMANFESVKEGSDVTFKVWRKNQIEDYEKETGQGTVNIGTDSNIENITYSEYEDRLAKGLIDEEIYSVDNTRPIAVYGKNAKGDEVHLGFLHTAQWVLKDREVPMEDVAKALRVNAELRYNVLKTSGTHYKNVAGKISGRVSNIGANTNNSAVTGAAIVETQDRRSSREIFKDDIFSEDNPSGVVVSVLQKAASWQDIIDTEVHNKLKSEGKNVIVPQFIQDDFENYAGAVVALVPIENSNQVQMTVLNTDQLDINDMDLLANLITGLSDQKFVQKLRVDTGVSVYPSRIRSFIKGLVPIRSKESIESNNKASFFHINVETTSGKMDKKGKLENPNIHTAQSVVNDPSIKNGETVNGGSIQYNVKIGTKVFNVTYAAELKKVVSRGETKVFINYKLASDPALLSELKTVLLSENRNRVRASVPFYNLKRGAIHTAQGLTSEPTNDSYTTRATVQGNSVTYSHTQETDYVNTQVLNKTSTGLVPPRVLPGGKKNYVKNTIVTVEVSSKQPKKEKKLKNVTNTEAEKKFLETLDTEESQVERELRDIDSILDILNAARSWRDIKIEDSNPLKPYIDSLKPYSLRKAKSIILEGKKQMEEKLDTLKSVTTKQDSEKDSVNYSASSNIPNKKEESKTDSFLESLLKTKKEVKETPKNKPNFMDMVKRARQSNKPDSVKNEIEELVSAEDREIVSAEDVEGEPKTDVIPKRQATILSKYKLKTGLSSNRQGKIPLKKIFNIAEKREIIASITDIFLEKFIQQNTDEISSAQIDAIIKGTVYDFSGILRGLISEISEVKTDKAVQYGAALESLLDSFYKEKTNPADRKAKNDLVFEAMNKAIRILGYNKRTKSNTTDETGTDDEFSQEDVQQSYQDINYSLFKNPADKATAKIKARLYTLKKYTLDGNGGVEKDISMLGTYVSSTESYAYSLSLFSGIPSNSVSSKIEALQKFKMLSRQNPEKYVNQYFLNDLLDLVHGPNKMSVQDIRKFNRAMNNNELIIRTLNVKGSRLFSTDLNHANVTTKYATTIMENLEDIRSDRDSLEIFKKNIIGNSEKYDFSIRSNNKINKNLSILDLLSNADTLHSMNLTDLAQAIEFSYHKRVIALADLQNAGDALIVFNKKAQEIYAYRVFDVFRTIGLNDDSIYSSIVNSIKEQAYISKVNYSGDVKRGELKFIKAVDSFIKSLINDKLKPNPTPAEKALSLSTRAIISDFTAKGFLKHSTTFTRVGSKLVGTYNDKIAFIDILNKIHYDESYLSNLDNELFARNSLFKKILQGEGYPGLLKALTRAGLKPSFKSSTDKADDPFEHTLFTLGNYIQSLGLASDKADKHTPLEVEFEQGPQTVKHTVQSKLAKFSLSAFSDKDTPFMVDSLDFDSVNFEENGSISIKEEVLRLFIDSVVTPQLNAMVQTLGLKKGEMSFDNSLIYSVPTLNTPEFLSKVKSLSPNVELNSLFADSPYNNIEDNANYEDIRSIVMDEVSSMIQTSASKYMLSLQEKGVLKIIRGYAFMEKDLAGLEDMKSFISDEPTLSLNRAFNTTAAQEITYSIEDSTQLVSPIAEVVLSFMEDIPQAMESVLDRFSDKVQNKLKAASALEDDKEKTKAIYKILRNDFHLKRFSSLESLYDKLSDLEDADNITENKVFSIFDSYTKGDQDTYSDSKDKTIFSKVLNKSFGKNDFKTNNKFIKINTTKFLGTLVNREIGQQLLMQNMQQLVFGDMSSYFKKAKTNANATDFENNIADIRATYTNAGKRYAQFVSPANFGDVGPEFYYVVIKEPTENSKFYNGTNGLDKIEGISVMDAGSFVGEKGRIEDMLLNGEISEDQVPIIKKYWAGKLSEEELGTELADKVSLVVAKPRDVGYRNESFANTTQDVESKSNGLKFGRHVRLPQYAKLAESVVNESKVGKTDSFGKRVLDVINHLEKKTGKTVRVIPPTALKVGKPKELLDIENMSYDELGNPIIPEGAYFTSNYETRGEQVRTDYKRGKKNKASGQVENGIWNSVPEGHKGTIEGKEVVLRDLWESTIEEIHNIKLSSLNKVLSSDNPREVTTLLNTLFSGGYDAVNEMEIVSSIDSLDDKGLSALISGSLKALGEDDVRTSNPLLFKWMDLDSNGNFKYDLTLSPKFQTYLDAIRKTIEKTTVTSKRLGFQLPLESDILYDLKTAGVKDGSKIYLLESAVKGIMDNDGSLRPQMPSDGEPKPAQILIPFDFTTVNGGRLKLDSFLKDVDGRTVVDVKRLPKEIFEAIGYRTPTQDYNMMSHVEVVGFLPKGYKNTVVAPKEFVATMGSDFDIDKLFGYQLYLKSVVRNGEEYVQTISSKDAEQYPMFALENRKIKIMQSILSDNNIIRDHIAKSLDREKEFVEFADEQDLLVNPNSATRGLLPFNSPVYQEEKRNSAAGAADAIGVFAKLYRTAALVQLSPINIFKEIEGVPTESSIKLGSQVFRKFGDSRPSIFTDSEGIEKEFDERKNNISTLITIAVDNENLQMLHKLGILEKGAYTNISSAIMLGFKAKTAIAMSNLTTLSADTGLIKKVAKTKGDIKSKDFSLFKKGKLNEKDLELYLTKINKAVQSYISLSNSTEQSSVDIAKKAGLTPQMAKDFFAIKDFVKQASMSYKESIGNFSWLVNLDSKGFSRNIPKMYKELKSINSPIYADVVEQWDKIKEINLNINYFKTFMNKVEEFYAKADPAVVQVYNILTDSNADINGMHEVFSKVREQRLKKYRPSITSLVNRIRTLRNSEEAMEFIANNSFLSNLSARGNKLVFSKPGDMPPADILHDFEALNTSETLAGLDLRVLHEDLVKYGLTVNVGYGESFMDYIDPKYTTVLEKNNTEDIDVRKIAAYVGYKNTSALAVSTNTNRSTGVWWNPATQNVNYVDAKGSIQAFTKEDADSFESGSSGNSANNIVSTTSEVEKDYLNNENKVIDVYKTTERLFSSPSMQPLKTFMRMIYGDEATVKKVMLLAGETVSNSFYNGANKTVGIANGTTTQIKNDLVHESVHASIQEVLNAYNTGTLAEKFPGKGLNETISKELTDIFQSMDESREDIYDYVLDRLNNWMKFPDSGFGLDGPTLVQSVLQTDAVQGIANIDIYNSIPEELDTESKDMFSFLKALHEDNYSFRDRTDTGVPRMSLRIGDSTIEGTYVDSKRRKLYKGIVEYINHVSTTEELTTDQAISTIVKRASQTVGSKTLDEVREYTYGLSNLSEFMASAFAMGNEYNLENTPLSDYATVSNYRSIASRNTPNTVSKIYKKVIDLIKKLVDVLAGPANRNLIFKDVTYAMTLVKNANFVNYRTNGVQKVPYINNFEDIIKRCK